MDKERGAALKCREGDEEDLLEHRTDGTDAFDTLYIGCEKFPQEVISSVNYSGFG